MASRGERSLCDSVAARPQTNSTDNATNSMLPGGILLIMLQTSIRENSELSVFAQHSHLHFLALFVMGKRNGVRPCPWLRAEAQSRTGRVARGAPTVRTGDSAFVDSMAT